MPLEVELTEFYAKENAVEHHTEDFEIVQENRPTPVLRRGQYFFMAVRFQREMDSVSDILRLVFSFGETFSENNIRCPQTRF